MNTLTLPLRSGRPTPRSGLWNFFSGLGAGIREGLALAARYDTLIRMSDSELARLGLRREDRPRAVLTGRIR